MRVCLKWVRFSRNAFPTKSIEQKFGIAQFHANSHTENENLGNQFVKGSVLQGNLDTHTQKKRNLDTELRK